MEDTRNAFMCGNKTIDGASLTLELFTPWLQIIAVLHINNRLQVHLTLFL